MRVSEIAAGSSPHTRGARLEDGVGARGVGIIPAYAGSTLEARVSIAFSQDHPRIRGEHFHQSSTGVMTVGSSPHTRGARVACRSRDG